MINIDLKLWKKVQEDFANVVKLPVVTIDEKGEEIVKSNSYPFYCELIKSKSDLCKNCRIQHMRDLKEKIEIYECHAGLTNVMAPIVVDNKKLGAILFTSILGNKNERYIEVANKINVEADELKDELEKLELVDESKIKSLLPLMEVFSKSIPDLAKQSQNYLSVISELNLVRKLSNVLGTSLDLDSVIRAIMSFFVDSFKLSNCSITLFNEERKYSFNETDTNVEGTLINVVKQTNHLVDIRDASKSYWINGYKGAILAVPLRVSNKTIGVISLYSENPIDNLGLFSTLAEQISLGIMNALNYRHVSEESVTDRLTGLYNRGNFNLTITKELARSSRLGKPISLIILDIDNFKKLNDSCGHLKGDQVLRDVANIVKDNIRTMDTAFRYGGEEFILLLPETNSPEATKISERVRKAVESHNFIASEKHDGKLTISLGLVTCANSKTSPEKLVKEADICLYRAKNSGKNKSIGALIVDERINAINLDDVDKMYKP